MKNKIKIIIPAAGAGKRLFPHTYSKPKPMVYLAGKPIIGHILDRLRDFRSEEIIIIVGYKKEQIISYVDNNYSDVFNIRYIDQKEQLGLGHSIYVAMEEIGNSNIMIALGDNIFKANYLEFYEQHLANGKCAGSVGIIEVDDTRKYGIVELDGPYIKKLLEKPLETSSNLGIAGVYFINDTPILISIIKEMIEKNRRTQGEYQLTDALQEMVTMGYNLKTVNVTVRYDCGRSDSLLEANHILLNEKRNHQKAHMNKDSIIIQPVAIGDNVSIINSVIGPYVSIADDSYIEKCVISESIIGSGTRLSNANLQNSIIGDDTNVQGKYNLLNIGDRSSIEF
jgi:glucose-1-phosphate thymidylyltransferase